jgi:hypothetical protein
MHRLFIGMDVHKEKIVVVGLPGEGSHPVLREEFNGGNLPRLVKQMKAMVASWPLELCYKAGPCGYGLARELAMSLRAGTLEFVQIPSGEEEEVPRLIRCREDIARQIRLFKMTVSHWLLSRDIRALAGTKRWSAAY